MTRVKSLAHLLGGDDPGPFADVGGSAKLAGDLEGSFFSGGGFRHQPVIGGTIGPTFGAGAELHSLFTGTRVGVVMVGILRLVDPLIYPPDDYRSQPWFYPVTSGALIIIGLLTVFEGLRRLRRGS